MLTVRCCSHNSMTSQWLWYMEQGNTIMPSVAYSHYLHPTNIAPTALQRADGGQPPHGGQPPLIHLVAQRWAAKVGLGRAAEGWLPLSLWPASTSTDFLLHWFWPTTANIVPPLCLLQQHRVGFQSSITGWIVVAGLLCAESPHVHQRPADRPLDVIRRPPCPPPCWLPSFGGWLCSAYNFL